MEISELIEIVNKDEDSKHQFKATVTNELSLAQELIAFSNSGGGQIFIGVQDSGEFAGLTRDDMHRLSNLVSNAASQQVRPPINVLTENIATDNGLVMCISVADGISKPYMDKNGAIWVKSGADKRKATSREELQRMYQRAGLVHGDVVPVQGFGISNLDKSYFQNFFENYFSETLEEQELSIEHILQNMNLMHENNFNISGALLFSKNPQFKLPSFIVKAIAFPHEHIDETTYLDSKDIVGKLSDIYEESIAFLLNNIHNVQNGQDINSLGSPEIPKIVLEELFVNAIIHRDYFISSPIRIFIFSDRIEIISPGHLPNNLTIQNIKSGNSNMRNPVLASFATRILPYRGLGSGIIRSLRAYPHITFEDDRDGNLFIVTIRRLITE